MLWNSLVCDIRSSRLVDELSLEESYRYSLVDCDIIVQVLHRK